MKINQVCFWFGGISTIVGYLMTNPLYTYIQVKVKLTTLVEDGLKAPFSIATTPRSRGGFYFIPWIALDPYLSVLSAKQGEFKYHFF